MDAFFNLFLELDLKILYFFNSLSSNILDWPMVTLSAPISWIILLITLLTYYRNKLPKTFLKKIMLLLVICFSLTDFISGNILKPNIKRLRPCKVKEIRQNLNLHKVEKCGGKFGFVSSHAANSFGIAFLLIFLLKTNNLTSLSLLFLSTMVGISRMYLGKHYPSDLIFGMFLGLIISFIISRTKMAKIIKATKL